MKKIFSFLFLLILVIFISGCGTSEEDCKKLDTTYKKYYLDEESGECLYKTLKKDICGNGVIEEGETYCNCPKDVDKSNPKLGCDGVLGDYLEKTCNKETKKCEYFQNNKVVLETKVLEFKNSDIIIEGEFKLNRPFIINSADNNVLSVKLSLFNILESSNKKITNIKVKSISIINGKNILFGNFDFNKNLNNIGDELPEAKIKLNDISSYKSRENLKIKLVISYIKTYIGSNGEITKTENKVETLSQSLGYWEIINPNFEPEKKKYGN